MKESNVWKWVRLSGRTWWPGQLVTDLNEDLKAQVAKRKFCKVVQFIEEEAPELVTKETDLLSYDETGTEKKEELIRKSAANLRLLKDKTKFEKFRSDVIKVESTLTNRSKELTGVWFDNLLLLSNKKPNQQVKLIFAPHHHHHIFVIDNSNRKQPQAVVIAPAPPDTRKRRFTCTDCGFSCDRLGALTSHRIIHTKGLSPIGPSPTNSNKRKSPVKKKLPVVAQVPTTSPTRKRKSVPLKSSSNKRSKTVATTGLNKEILADWIDEEEDIDDDDEDDHLSGSGGGGGCGDKDAPPELRIFETEHMADDGGKLLRADLLEVTNDSKKGGNGGTLPRTDQELSDAFEVLLRNTKPPTFQQDQDHVDGGVDGGGSKVEDDIGGSAGSLDDGGGPSVSLEAGGGGPALALDDGGDPISAESDDDGEATALDDIPTATESEPPQLDHHDQHSKVTETLPTNNEVVHPVEPPPAIEEVCPPTTTTRPPTPPPTPAPAPPSQSQGKPTAAIRPTSSERSPPPPAEQTETTTEVEDSESKHPTEQIVHLVPVENQDGTVTYMLLSLNQQPTPTTAGPHPSNQQQLKVSTASSDSSALLMLNPEEMEGIYMDKVIDPGTVFSSLTATPTPPPQQNESNNEGGNATQSEGQRVIYVQQSSSSAEEITWESIVQQIIQQ